MTYATKISLKKKNGTHKRRSSRRLPRPPKKSRRHVKKSNSKKYRKIAVIRFLQLSFGLVAIFVALISLFFFSTLQGLSQDLPTPEKPFGKKNTTSQIFDRNGNLLYRVFDEEDRDPVKLEELKPIVKWAFLAAEDINYYSHPGVDVFAVLRCAARYVNGTENTCGGSTVTQQLIKKTVLTDEVSLDRKLKEMILAMQIEQVRTKDEILEMYLKTIPEGSNIYGVTRASQFYFGRNVNKLNLAEIAVLASIPQNPSRLSPTKSLSPEIALDLLKDRQLYVLDQMEQNMDMINARIMKERGFDKPVLTKERIEEARNFKLKFVKPRFKISAPHFVFYVQDQLQRRGYNDGKPFTLEEIETEGLRIYTTLDLSKQKIAEEQVRKGVEQYGSRYGAENASLIAMNPKNGEIIAYVGSYNYFGKPSPKGCTLGRTCKFEPQVSILNSLQAYGSTMKPMLYYEAIMRGLISPNTILSDVPIDIRGFKPKNYEGGFVGNKTARWMLVNSRNIPPMWMVDYMGVPSFLQMLKKWGYTSFKGASNYGPSIVVGGADVRLIEHAQAYQVFANEGKLNKHEVILRIEDTNGNVIYQHKPKPKQVADPRGVYLVNNMLNGRYGGPGWSFDGRDIAGKTGTSESQKETMFVTYTPELIVVGWLGNNDNTPMYYGASGFGTARPWVSEFFQRVGSSIPPTPFRRPEGVYYDSYGNLVISGKYAPSYLPIPAYYKPVYPQAEVEDENGGGG